MSCNLQTWISLNLASSSTSLCNPRWRRRRVSSFLSRTTRQRHFHGFHVARSRIFSSQPPLLSADRRWSLSAFASSSSNSLELPLLPFGVDHVLVPSESKTLHLYEARYLALLEESLFRKNKLFVHFVLDPVAVSDSSREISFAARYACLVLIENVERLEVGALVTIRGIGRVKIIELLQADPYLRGTILPVRDSIVQDESRLSTKVVDVKDVLHNLNSLEIKLKINKLGFELVSQLLENADSVPKYSLSRGNFPCKGKAPKEALLQTNIMNSLAWAEKCTYVDIDENFVPSLAERVSFAAFQPISGSTESELQSLQFKKLKAMEIKHTLIRLNRSLKLTKANISTVAAKLAIQSAEIQ